jgi:hypothetical protein
MRVEGYAGSLERVISGGSGVRLCRVLDMDFPERPEDELRRTP